MRNKSYHHSDVKQISLTSILTYDRRAWNLASLMSVQRQGTELLKTDTNHEAWEIRQIIITSDG